MTSLIAPQKSKSWTLSQNFCILFQNFRKFQYCVLPIACFPSSSWNSYQRIWNVHHVFELLGIEGWGPWSPPYVSSVCTRQSSSLGLLLNFRCFSSFCVPLFSETAGCRPPLEDRSLWRWDCLSFASVWRGASVTAHHTVGFRFLGWQELQVLFCSWGFFPWLAHLDATQASCVPCVVTCGEAFASSVRFYCHEWMNECPGMSGKAMKFLHCQSLLVSGPRFPSPSFLLLYFYKKIAMKKWMYYYDNIIRKVLEKGERKKTNSGKWRWKSHHYDY